LIGASPSGKAAGFDPAIRRFESSRPSHFSTLEAKQHVIKMMVFTGNANPALARKVADRLYLALGNANVSKFSDGEITVELNENVRGKDVFVLQSTCQPTNDNIMELLLMIDALRRASAARITAVVPYFGYARQDRRVRSARVPISSKVVADMMVGVGVDRVLTVTCTPNNSGLLHLSRG
jgi:ribose-phosphate pyrophosphokinase